MPPSSHPFLNVTDAKLYESWYSGPGKRADRLEKRLLRWCLGQFADARSILEVGSGTGHFSRWFAGLGLDVTGLDNSPAMLREAQAQRGTSYVEGDAVDLPMASRSFDLVAFITTLEFVNEPARALAEAIRVGRHGLILGVLNRTSLLAWRRKRAGGPVWSAATFFSPGELVERIRQADNDRVRSVHWRTTLWPLPLTGSLPLPWGGFVGMAVKLDDGTRNTSP